MKRTIRIYDMAGGKSQNIETVEAIHLVVHRIDERAKRVFFVLNPNITEYQETRQKQSIGFQGTSDTREGNMTPSDPPFSLTIDGTKYQIAVDSVGTEKDGRVYCDFAISWD